MPFPETSDPGAAGRGIQSRQWLMGHLLVSIWVLWTPPGFGESGRQRDAWPARIRDRADAPVGGAGDVVNPRESASRGRIADSRIDSLPLVGPFPTDVRGAVPQESGNRRTPMEVRMPTPAFRTEVPAHAVDVLLARPTRTSVTLSVLAYEPLEGRVAWKAHAGRTQGRTDWAAWPKGEPVELVLDGLEPGTRYHYELAYRGVGGEEVVSTSEHSFDTAPPSGASFCFAVQADSHLDFGTDPEVYRASLQAVLASGADFLVDLGDTFMTDKYLRYTDATAHYLAQRYYLGLAGHSVPVFLTLGNHDGERLPPRRRTAGADAMSMWSNAMRKRYFPNPVPDAFYGGNALPHPEAGLLQNYYAWEWGDALFVVLDPYWYSARQRNRAAESLDQWAWTLGADQYRWLARTLETSQAAFKFVFTHQLVGGATREGRGGLTAAALFEWGGRDAEGRSAFRERRPGWAAPIHELLARHGGSVVFHGHDHMYARGELDGVVYQLVPQPGHGRPSVRSAEEYGYAKETVLPGSGVLVVHVSPTEARVDYLQVGRQPEPRTAHSYRLLPRRATDE